MRLLLLLTQLCSLLGPGAVGPRASFATIVTDDAPYNVGVVLGADWATWVDQSYV